VEAILPSARERGARSCNPLRGAASQPSAAAKTWKSSDRNDIGTGPFNAKFSGDLSQIWHARAARPKPDNGNILGYIVGNQNHGSVHQIMNQRRSVVLADGRIGKIMRVDTWFPDNDTKVTIWTANGNGPGLAKIERVELKDVVGVADQAGQGQGA
jgi:hypothetical protein